jgi:hypothetical protein
MTPSSLTCGSAKSSIPLSRMHWANSNVASCAGSLEGGAVAPAAPTVANAAAVVANVAMSRELLIAILFSMRGCDAGPSALTSLPAVRALREGLSVNRCS